MGNQYQYAYDTSGNLASVTNPAQYTGDASHIYTGGTDPRGNALPGTTYYTDGKLKSGASADGGRLQLSDCSGAAA